MAAPLFNRWLAASPADRPAKVAVRALKTRLAAVRHFLKRAAKQADEDVKYVHELRVATRRASAAITLFEEFLPRRRAKWLEKQLDRVRRAANDARDLDVLMDRLQEERKNRARRRWLKQAKRQRAKAQRPIVANYRRLQRGHRFARRIEKFLARIKSRGSYDNGRRQRFGEWAQRRLRPISEAFFRAEPGEGADATAWHQFRIRGKELRYAMELLAGGFAREFQTRLYPLVEALQDKLGDMNDLATSQTRLHERIGDTDDADERRGLQLLLDQEQAKLEFARREFLLWYRGEPHETLQEGLSQFERPLDLGRVRS